MRTADAFDLRGSELLDQAKEFNASHFSMGPTRGSRPRRLAGRRHPPIPGGAVASPWAQPSSEPEW